MPTGVYKRTKKYLRKLKKQGFQKGHKTWSKGKHFYGKDSPNWKGGIKRTKFGYIFLYKPKHPFCNCQGYIFEHRLVIEKYLKRYLKPEEITHHFGKRDDNRLQMLMAFVNHSAHLRFEKGGKVKPSEIIFDGRNLHNN